MNLKRFCAASLLTAVPFLQAAGETPPAGSEEPPVNKTPESPASGEEKQDSDEETPENSAVETAPAAPAAAPPVPSANEAHQPAPDAGKDNNGLGFGIGGSGVEIISLFYDYNIYGGGLLEPATGFEQVHVQYFSGYEERRNFLGGVVTSRKTRISLSLRRVWPSGWFFGAGAGYEMQSLVYDMSSKAEFSATKIPVFLGGGWQGDDYYYFTVSLQAGSYIDLDEDFDLNKIPDEANHRETVDTMWKELGDSPGAFLLNFGWYIDP